MYIKDRILSMTKSTSSDVVGYNFRAVNVGSWVGDEADYENTPAAMATLDAFIDNGDDTISIDLADSLVGLDGDFDVVVTATDGLNESEAVVVSNVNFDFVAPEPPTGVTIS